ncbi:hypothetical protein ASD35_11560 [Pelomonas sp. Root1444]|nr:hypothetical protein ASD35_11560 [Pelomonas sp. Root1444]
MQVGKAPAAMEEMRRTLGLSLHAASWLLSAIGIVGALIGVGVGGAADRLGAKRVAIAGLMLQGTAAAGAALFPYLPVVFAARVFEGLGFQATTVAVPALIATAMPRDTRAPALAAWSTFMPVGLCVALAGAPLLLTHGWQALWWASALLAFAWAVLLLIWAPREPQRERHRFPAAALLEVVHASGPRLLGVLFFLFSATYFSLAGFLPVLLMQAGVQDPSHASRLAGWAVLAGAAGNLLGAWLLARGVCAQRLVRAAFLLTAICTTGVLMINSGVVLRYALCLVFCVLSALIPPALFAQVPLRAPRPELAGATTGIMMQGNSLGLVLGPALAGAAQARWSWPAVALLVASFCATAMAAAVGGKR